MFSKRLISLLSAIICTVGICAAPFFAAADPSQADMTRPTQKPTQAPTEPPLTVDHYGYAKYAEMLDKTVYTGELGAIYTPDFTTFRLWSPVADNIRVCVYTTGSDDEEGARMLYSQPMTFVKKNGGWYTTIAEDLRNMYYTYQVTIDDETHEVVDPYAKAVGVNGNRGMIVDLDATDPAGWASDSFTYAAQATDAVIWEISVRDFSASETSGVSEENRGKFLAFTESGTVYEGYNEEFSTCVDYLKELGVNYVQINPFYDFASIDESEPLDDQYNWGYDPKNYNVPEGSYSSNPYDGNVRITECKQMIQALHSAGIGVIMDVVYNHTYESENSFFNQLVPDYYYRIDEDGSWSNGSDCGNDIATERYMVRRFICDSVTYWAEEYHIDGFRFDLMGLMDCDTMLAVRESLDALPGGKRILMYGEGWDMETSCAPGTKLATQDNIGSLSRRIAAFNDAGRDAIKGSPSGKYDTGFIQDGISAAGNVKAGIKGMIKGDATGWASIPNQVVNYTSCHDNLTLHDKLVDTEYSGDDYSLRYENLTQMNKLSAAIVLTSRGIPFMLAGEEMGRTKNGNKNSYNASVEVNQIDWSLLERYPSMVDYYSGLIEMRGAIAALRDSTGATEIEFLESDESDCIAYSATMQNEPIVIVAYNGSDTETARVTLPAGSWVLLANGERAGLTNLGEFSGEISVPHTSAAVLVNAAGFRRIGKTQDHDIALLYARIRDRRNKTVVFEQKVYGKIGHNYSVEIPNSVLMRYNINDSLTTIEGTFSDSFEIVSIDCEKYDGAISSVTFYFRDEDDHELVQPIMATNRVGQQYYSQPIPLIEGYVLDLDRLPTNAAGLYTEDPINVYYYFLKADSVESDADMVNNCRANIIYMGSDGEILRVETLYKPEGELVSDYIDRDHEFKGYTFNYVSDNYAVFSSVEANVIVNYEKKKPNYLPYILIGAASVLLIGSIVMLFVSKGRRKKMASIAIDD